MNWPYQQLLLEEIAPWEHIKRRYHREPSAKSVLIRDSRKFAIVSHFAYIRILLLPSVASQN